MPQQVNLYRQMPKKVKVPISNETLLLLYGICVLILLLQSSYYFWLKHKKTKTFQAAEMQLITKENQLKSMIDKYPELKGKNIESSMQELQQQLNAKARIVEILLQGITFSDELKAFAMAIPSGMWLTDIAINDYGKNITLRGFAQQSNQIQEYIHNLTQQPVFSKHSFDLSDVTKVVIKANGNANEYINFTIKSNNKAVP